MKTPALSVAVAVDSTFYQDRKHLTTAAEARPKWPDRDLESEQSMWKLTTLSIRLRRLIR
jgi:hypothetical protein